MAALEQRDHPVPPVKRAPEAVQEHDRGSRVGGGGRPPVDDLEVARGQLEDPAAVDRHLGVLGLVVDDDRVDREQGDQRDAGSRSRSSRRASPAAFLPRREPELVRALGHRLDHERDVLVVVDARAPRRPRRI